MEKAIRKNYIGNSSKIQVDWPSSIRGCTLLLLGGHISQDGVRRKGWVLLGDYALNGLAGLRYAVYWR